MGPDCEKNSETEKERARQTQREERGWTNGLYKSEAESRREFSVFFLLTLIAPGLASLCLCASTFTALYKV